MASQWTVDAVPRRLKFSLYGTEQWIDVKSELNVGEQKKVDAAGLGGMTKFGAGKPGEPEEDGPREAEIGIDWEEQSFVRTRTWLLDWSLADDAGNKLKFDRDGIQALRTDVYKTIETAINAHVEALEKEKKDRSGGPSPRAT